MATVKKLQEVLNILYEYNGNNPYIKMLKYHVYTKKEDNVIGDFQIDYILKNKDYTPITVNKVTKIPQWYGEELQQKWETDFIPQKLLVTQIFGETQLHYSCYVKYRQSVEPVMLFLQKKAIINNLFATDFHNYPVDFNRYDKLSTEKDSNRVLREHQKEGVKFLLSRKHCILADDMGLGKTTTLSVAAIEGNFDSVLIICPASLKTNWRDELLWYVSEKDITIIDSFNDKKKEELEEFLGYGKGKSGKKKEDLLEEAKTSGKWKFNRFVIVNYDILDEFFTFKRTLTEETKRQQIENSPILKYIYNRKSCIIADEAHKLSNTTSKRYQVIKNLIKKGNPECVFLTTGTPITNNPMNLFCILALIENEITSDMEYYKYRYCDAKQFLMKGEYEKWKNNFYKYKHIPINTQLSRERYTEMKDYIWNNGRKITTANGAINLDELKERIAHIYIRRTKEDIGNLPEKHIHEVYYTLTHEQKVEYDRLWDEYEKAQLEQDENKELNKDLLEGAIYRKYISNLMVLNTIKLCDKILETEDKVVIACCYDEELYTLKEHYGDSAVIYNGKCSLKQKDQAIDDFKHKENVKIFLGNIIASGVGITLTCSKSMIYNNFSWIAADNNQMSDRIHRIGQTKDCDIYYQIYKDTQYEHMWDIVLKKQLISEKLIKKETEK